MCLSAEDRVRIRYIWLWGTKSQIPTGALPWTPLGTFPLRPAYLQPWLRQCLKSTDLIKPDVRDLKCRLLLLWWTVSGCCKCMNVNRVTHKPAFTGVNFILISQRFICLLGQLKKHKIMVQFTWCFVCWLALTCYRTGRPVPTNKYHDWSLMIEPCFEYGLTIRLTIW